MKAEIRLAQTERDQDAVFAFRYHIYVEEMHRHQKYADHVRRRICDPLDSTAYNLAAWSGDAIVGCVRVNLAHDSNLEYYRSLLKMDTVAASYPQGCSLSTRLMVHPEWRGGTLPIQLSIASFELGLRHSVRWNFIDCNDHLVGFFERMGFEWMHKAVHEEYGTINAMCLNVGDFARRKAPGSPFRRSVEKFELRQAEAGSEMRRRAPEGRPRLQTRRDAWQGARSQGGSAG